MCCGELLSLIWEKIKVDKAGEKDLDPMDMVEPG